MAKLIDSYLKQPVFTQTKDGKLYISRPLPFYGIYGTWLRLKDAILVIRGKAEAVKFYEG